MGSQRRLVSVNQCRDREQRADGDKLLEASKEFEAEFEFLRDRIRQRSAFAARQRREMSRSRRRCARRCRAPRCPRRCCRVRVQFSCPSSKAQQRERSSRQTSSGGRAMPKRAAVGWPNPSAICGRDYGTDLAGLGEGRAGYDLLLQTQDRTHPVGHPDLVDELHFGRAVIGEARRYARIHKRLE